MKKYICHVCGYRYDPENNNGVDFHDLPHEWVCPECGAGRERFEEI